MSVTRARASSVKAPTVRRQQRERQEQEALIVWRDLFAPSVPALKWLHASLNGVYLTPGQARKAKAGGMVAGIWDIFLPDHNDHITPFCGLYIEMKAPGAKLTPEQESFRDEHLHGHRFAVCYSWIEAALVICDYLYLPDDHPARRAAQ